MFEYATSSYKDVTQFPEKFLQIDQDKVRIPVTYKKSWDDGFGARGWKVDASIGDPQIIASTRETGQRIPTSVFIHDILDHFLSGFGVSGHRSEAMALIQLFRRTGASPEPDYKQIIDEDILHGRVNGESMRSFLPSDLMALLPVDKNMTDKDIITYLEDSLGRENLTDTLVKHFFTLGKAGENHAESNWKKLGLDHHKQKEIGIALQKLLVEIDSKAEELGMEVARGNITIETDHVAFDDQSDDQTMRIAKHQVTINY